MKKILTLALIFLLAIPMFSVLLPKAYPTNLEETMFESSFESLEPASNNEEAPEVGSNRVPTYGFEPDLTRRSEPTSLSSDNELNSLAEQTLSWQKSTSVMATGTSTTAFFEDFEGAFPGSWSVGDSNPSGGSDYWGDTSYSAYGGSWSGWCADEGTQGGGTTTIFYEDFEGAWPGSWSVGDWNSGSGYDYWGDYSGKRYLGYWSGYCADIGSRPSGCGYDNDMEAYMYRSVSLSGYSSITLSYWYWTNIESDYDYLYVLYKVGGTWYITDSHTGSTAGWKHSSVSIPTTATYVGFYFYSDFIICDYDGAFVDEVKLEATGETPNKDVHKYDNYMDSYLSRGSFDARNWDLAYVTFYAWIHTESGYDFITFDTSGSGSGGPWNELWSRSGSYKYWSQHAVRIPDSDLTSNLWVGFDFMSDGSITYEGVYLDNIALKWYDVTLDNYNIDTTYANPGDTFTLGYYIDNPTPYTIDVGLGASIRDPSNTIINDVTHDIIVSASSGAHWYYRDFTVPSSAQPGLYDIAWGIWSGTPGSSRWWGGSDWQINVLIVESPNHAPDLSDGYVDPDPGYPDTNFKFLVKYTDQDGDSAVVKKIYVYDGRWWDFDMDHLAGNPTTGEWLIVWLTGFSLGSHDFYFYFTDGDLSDREPTSGYLSFTVEETPKPDLIVSDITWNPASPKGGDTMTFTVYIKNQGTADTSLWGSFDVPYYIDSVELGSWTISNLEAGDTVSRQFTWTATRGSHTVKAYADHGGFIPEIDDGNNEKQKSFTVEAGTITISGQLSYVDDQGNLQLVDGALVELYDEDWEFDDWLDSAYTTSGGLFVLGPIDNIDNELGESGTRDLYIKVKATNWAVNVVSPGVLGSTYEFQTVTFPDVPDGEDDWVVSCPSALNGVFNILSVITKGNRYVDQIDETPPQVLVTWPDDDDDATSEYDGPPRRLYQGIYLEGPNSATANPEPDEFSDEVILHEYGHFIMDKMAELPSFSQGDDRHFWVEGWAQFFQAPIRHHLGYPDPEVYPETGSNLETWRNIQDEYMTVGSILWDIYDQTDDDQDGDGIGDSFGFAMGFNEIWDVFRNYDPDPLNIFHNHPTTIHEFWDGWFARGHDYRQNMWAVYYEHGINKDDTDPNNPTSYSSSHQIMIWSNYRTIAVTWMGATDDTSGVQGYSIVWGSSSTTLPPELATPQTGTSSSHQVPSDGTSWYLHVRTVDRAGNWADDAYHIGPFYVDSTTPSVDILSPSDGATMTTSVVEVTWVGSDATSGIDHYEIRLDSGSWINKGLSASHTFSGVTGDSHVVEVKAVDRAGLDNTDSHSFNVILLDGEISDYVVLTPTVMAGEKLRVEVTVENTGAIRAEYNVYIGNIWDSEGTSAGNAYSDSHQIIQLDPGDSQTLTLEWTTHETMLPADYTGDLHLQMARPGSGWEKHKEYPDAISFIVFLEFLVSLSSRTTAGETNIGSIDFDYQTYDLPKTIFKKEGIYEVTANLPHGYDFDSWEYSGSISVSSSASQTTRVTVWGDCSLKAVFKGTLVALSVSATIVEPPVLRETVGLRLTVRNTGTAQLDEGLYIVTVSFWDYPEEGGIDSFGVRYIHHHAIQLGPPQSIAIEVSELAPGEEYTQPQTLRFPVLDHQQPTLILADTIDVAVEGHGVTASTKIENVDVLPGLETYCNAILAIVTELIPIKDEEVKLAIDLGLPVLEAQMENAMEEFSNTIAAADEGDVAEMAKHLAKMGIYMTLWTTLLSPEEQLGFLVDIAWAFLDGPFSIANLLIFWVNFKHETYLAGFDLLSLSFIQAIGRNLGLSFITDPTNILVIDPLGRRCGFDYKDGLIISEIPDAYIYGLNGDVEAVFISEPIEGEYEIYCAGLTDGSFGLHIEGANGTSLVCDIVYSGIISEGEILGSDIIVTQTDEGLEITTSVPTPLGQAYTNKEEYEVGETVLLSFQNIGEIPITLTNTAPWVILDEFRNVVYRALGAMTPVDVNPGESEEWQWKQKDDFGNQVFPGIYLFRIYTLDGNYTASFSIVDTTPPTIQIISPQNTTYAANDVDLTFIIDEPTYWIGYSLDGQANVTSNGNTILTSLGEGSHNIIVYANDTYGNMGFSNIVYFTIDTTSPTTDISLSGTLGLDEWYISDVTVTLTANDDVSGVAARAYSLDGTTWITYTGLFTISSEGITTVYYNSTDNAGNIEETKSTTVKIDKTNPMTTIDLTGTLGNDGWYLSDVTVTLGASDATSGILQIEYSFDDTTWIVYTTPFVIDTEGTTTVYVRSTDNAGNFEPGTFDVKIDKTPPDLTKSLSGTLGNNDWYVSDVTVTLSGSDSVSGLDSIQYSFDGTTWYIYSTPFVISSEGITTLYHKAYDVAGNEFVLPSQQIKIDKTPPTITGAPTTSPHSYGWYNTDVMVNFTVTDTISGVSYVTPDQTLISEGADQSVTGTAIDQAGNTAHYTVTGINIDKTPPTITGAATTPPNTYGWYNTDVTVHFTASDSLSGVDYVTPDQIISTEGSDQSTTGTATDLAGNSATYTVSGINIDKTPPTITGAPIDPANSYGWHNVDVIIHFTASDSLSGVDTVTPDQTISSEGADQSITGYATDRAGNTASHTVVDINIDKTPPTITGAPTTPANVYGWYNTDVVVHFEATDSLSGIESITPDQTLSAEGADQSVTGTATDKAGNTASYTVFGINIDKTPPIITGNPTTPANSYGWYNTDVTVHFDATDTLSEIATITPDQTLTSEGAGQSVTGTATDKAGNSASYTVSGINIDKTAPTITGAPTTPANAHGWYNTDVTVHFVATDTLSGVLTVTPDQTIATEGADQAVTGTATDLAGNEASYTVSGINIDKTPPSITGSPTTPANAYGWYNTDVIVHFDASDSLAGLFAVTPDQTLSSEGAGQSVTGTAIDLAGNEASCTVSGINIDKTPPNITGAPTTSPNAHGWYNTDVTVHFTASDSLSGLDTVTSDQTLTGEGAGQSVTGLAIDKAGNSATYTVNGINIDKTDPTTSLTVGEPKFGANPTYVTTTTDFTLEASDAISDIDYAEYKINSGAWTTYSTPFNVLDFDSHTIYYRSVDVAGNVEDVQSIWIVVNAASISYCGDVSGQYSDEVTVEAMLTDMATQQPISGRTITFTIGSQSITAVTDSLGLATASIVLDQQAEMYTVSATFTGDMEYLACSDSQAFAITRENAEPEYTGDTVVPTTAKSINLRATIFDSSDGFWGDLTKIQVTFTIYAGQLSSTPYLTVTSIPVSSTDMPGVGVATATIDNLPENEYLVLASIDPNNYYSGPTSDASALTVYEPTGDFVTGGGWIRDSSGSKGNFGFNIKYNKRGKPQGNSLYVYREGGWNYIVKSNAWVGMAIDGNHAYFEAKCVIQKYNPATGELVWGEGNYKFRVDVWDNDPDGGVDVYQIRVWDKNGVVFHEAGFDPIGYLQGGNILIHEEKKKH
jgi:hypothetical protein